jgi:hypothetical protein
MAIGLAGYAFLGAALGAMLATMYGGVGWIALGVFVGANAATAAGAAVRLLIAAWRAEPAAQSRLA